ncbi:hypothetical protein [Maribacter sp. 2304DJ31-5]|uniref:hypothetical protein n=1 Tax=Maribacter sp. 2304DJ31-5 TaxID=3386273 RepID=UPI0039BD748F
MKDGMEQAEKELTQEKDKDIIPPLDLDSLDNTYIDIETPPKDKEKGMDMDI